MASSDQTVEFPSEAETVEIHALSSPASAETSDEGSSSSTTAPSEQAEAGEEEESEHVQFVVTDVVGLSRAAVAAAVQKIRDAHLPTRAWNAVRDAHIPSRAWTALRNANIPSKTKYAAKKTCYQLKNARGMRKIAPTVLKVLYSLVLLLTAACFLGVVTLKHYRGIHSWPTRTISCKEQEYLDANGRTCWTELVSMDAPWIWYDALMVLVGGFVLVASLLSIIQVVQRQLCSLLCLVAVMLLSAGAELGVNMILQDGFEYRYMPKAKLQEAVEQVFLQPIDDPLAREMLDEIQRSRCCCGVSFLKEFCDDSGNLTAENMPESCRYEVDWDAQEWFPYPRNTCFGSMYEHDYLKSYDDTLDLYVKISQILVYTKLGLLVLSLCFICFLGPKEREEKMKMFVGHGCAGEHSKYGGNVSEA